MLCEKPYMIGTVPCPCTRCFPCRVNRRRLWAHRMTLESLVSSDSSFVTLTYDEKNIPEGANLVPKHTQDWLKRIRKILAPQKIRYFLVGEYGDQTQRPHYHVALFGVHPYVAGGSDGQSGVVQRTWNRGFTYTGDLTPDASMYVAGYCTKKMTSRKDPRLNGRYPEFARMSLRPGIGAFAIKDIARSLKLPAGLQSIAQAGDVPFALNHGRRALPLGRYLRGRLREELGYSKETPLEKQKEYAGEMRRMFEEAKNAQKDKTVWNAGVLTKLWLDMNAQKIKNLRSRTQVYERVKTI